MPVGTNVTGEFTDSESQAVVQKVDAPSAESIILTCEFKDTMRAT